MEASQLIKLAISKGYVSDVLKIMKGESQYTTDNVDLSAALGKPGSEAAISWRMAMSHLEFICEYGSTIQKASKEGRYYSAYPEDFERWLELGAPGYPTSDLATFLNDRDKV